jgi:hypothetical protein
MRFIPRLVMRLLFGPVPKAPEGERSFELQGDDNDTGERIRVAVPVAEVVAREARIVDLLGKHGVEPDVVTILALRRVHDRLITYNRDLARAGMVHTKHEGSVH